jgi:hypothetical protein
MQTLRISMGDVRDGRPSDKEVDEDSGDVTKQRMMTADEHTWVDVTYLMAIN